MRLLLERSGTEVSLLPAIKRGGEGSIHPITGEPNMVAKVFSQPSRERAEKLRAMLDNPPIVAGNVPVTLAWPLDRLLTRAGECVGYVMPYVKGKEPLFTLYHPDSRPRSADYPFMLRAARNIAVAVSAFHRHDYVIGDINEFNILVGPDASVAVVDTDSIQVRTKRELFRCQVGKPEFTPPELLQAGTSFGQVDRSPDHDSFGLAVLIFLLLMDGNHPFAARYVGTAGRQIQTERMAQGQWPYSAGRKGAYRPRRQAPPLESLSPDIQRLMRECFEAGHHNPTCRPTADAWHQALTKAESEWNEFGTRLRYYCYRVLRPRAWGQSLLSIPDQLRVGVARVPRKAWITVASVVVIALLIFASLRWSRHSEAARPGAIGEQKTQQSEPERERGEETPWLWREAQRLNRLNK
jgi:DNA-binding helix-hairpin-helix protein with protein kinase domain